MSDTFITSDEHYGHENIIRYCKRPFRDVIHMREELILRHNKKVPDSPNMLTIHVGDMFWMTMEDSDAAGILHRLHGRHAFLYGNHDKVIEQSARLQGLFTWVRGMNKAGGSHLLHFNKKKLTLDHFARRTWEGHTKGMWHVYGHSHGELPPYGKSFDIGVDANDFTPWSLEEIEKKMAKLPIASEHKITPANAWRDKTPPPCETCGTEFSCLDCLRVERGSGLMIPRGDLEGY